MIENQKPDAELPIIQFHHVPAFWAFGGTICAIFCAIRVGCQQLAGIWTQFKLCHCKHTSSSHRKPKCPAAELKLVFPTYKDTGQHCKVQITTLINIPRFIFRGRGRLFGEKLGSTIVIDQAGIIAMISFSTLRLAVLQWFSMIFTNYWPHWFMGGFWSENHWSSNGMITAHCYGLHTILRAFQNYI